MPPQLAALPQSYLTATYNVLQAATLLKTHMTLSIRNFTPALENTSGGQDIFCDSHIKLLHNQGLLHS